MEQLDYIIILLYFLGLIAVSVVMSWKIKNSEDMFIAGRNSSWWLSGVSSYMTIFSASTFVVWGGVAYKSGLVAVVVALCLSVGATYSFALSSGLLPSLDSELRVEDAFLVAAFLAAHWLLVHL